MNHAVGRWLKVGVLTFVTAALVACAGAAGKPGAAGAPGAAAEVPPLPVGTIPDQALEVAGTKTVALGGYFSEGEGETLTYTAASSVATVATVSVSGSTLTITAVVVGSAVITVTATDEDSLTAKQAIKVTVTAAADPTPTPTPTPPTPTTPASDTIMISGTKAEVDLTEYLLALADASPANYELESRSPRVFSVAGRKAGSTSVWTINAVSAGKGMAEIVAKADGSVAKTLTVVVENRDPVRKTPLAEPGLGQLGDAVQHPTLKTMNTPDKQPLMLYQITVSPDTYFKDNDASDVLTYEITPSRDDVVIQAGGKCSATPCTVWLDIVRNRAGVNEFALEVEAVDSALNKSVVLAFPYRMDVPVPQTYKTLQFATSYDFRAITVGNRVGAKHDLTFDVVPPDMVVATTIDDLGGFAFAHAYIAKLAVTSAAITTGATGFAKFAVTTIADIDADPSASPAPANDDEGQVHYGRSTPPAPTPAVATETADTDGTIYAYTVKAGGHGRSASMLKVDGTGDPELVFQVDGVGAGTIEVGFHIWLDLDGETSTTDPITGNRHEAKWHSAKETLTVTVVSVK